MSDALMPPYSASELALEDALHAHDSMLARRDQLGLAQTEIAETSAQATTIGPLRCPRGIDTLTAVGLAAEVGDFGRFTHPRLLASYLGMVPSEQSSGEQRWQGAMTRAGSKHARRLLVEAAWQYQPDHRVVFPGRHAIPSAADPHNLFYVPAPTAWRHAP